MTASYGFHARPTALRPLLLRLLVGLIVLGGGLWVLGLMQGRDGPTTVAQEPAWLTAPEVQPTPPVPPPPDPRVDAMQQQLRAMQETQAAQTKVLEALLHRKEPTPQAGPPPKPRVHKPMQVTKYEVATAAAPQAPTYTLAAYSARIPCLVETESNSDSGALMTCTVSETVFDSATGTIPLIPQGAVIGVHYDGQHLMYGDRRLDTVSAGLTIGETTYDLGHGPLMTQAGTGGLVSDVDNHWAMLAGGVLIQSALKGSVQAVSTVNPYASALANSAAQAGTQVTQPWINAKPTIHVAAGTPAMVILIKPLELPRAY